MLFFINLLGRCFLFLSYIGEGFERRNEEVFFYLKLFSLFDFGFKFGIICNKVFNFFDIDFGELLLWGFLFEVVEVVFLGFVWYFDLFELLDLILLVINWYFILVFKILFFFGILLLCLFFWILFKKVFIEFERWWFLEWLFFLLCLLEFEVIGGIMGIWFSDIEVFLGGGGIINVFKFILNVFKLNFLLDFLFFGLFYVWVKWFICFMFFFEEGGGGMVNLVISWFILELKKFGVALILIDRSNGGICGWVFWFLGIVVLIMEKNKKVFILEDRIKYCKLVVGF